MTGVKKGELRVHYGSDDINTEMDRAIKKAIESFGYRQRASDYELGVATRDLAFDKLEDE